MAPDLFLHLANILASTSNTADSHASSNSPAAEPSAPCPPLESDREQSVHSCPRKHRRRATDNSACGRHWRYKDCADVAVHLIRGNDKAGTGLLNLHSLRRIKPDQKHVETLDYHSHSSSSQRVAGASFRISLSSPLAAICRNASSQPSRGERGFRMTKHPPCASISTSFCKWQRPATAAGPESPVNR